MNENLSINNLFNKASLFCLGLLFLLPSLVLSNSCDSLLNNLEMMFDADDLESIIETKNSTSYNAILDSCPCYEKGKISHLMGATNYFLNEELEAISHFKKAVFFYWKDCYTVTKAEAANTIYNIGISYQYTEHVLHGKEYLDSALLLIEQIDDFSKEDLAYKYQGAGSYYSAIGDFERANAYLRNAIELSEHIDIVDAFYTHIDLLSLLLRFQRNNEANDIITLIKKSFILKNNPLENEDHAIYHLNCAESFLRQKDYLKADSVCNKAIQLLDPSDANLLSNAKEILGVIQYRLGNFEASKDHYQTAYELRLQDDDIVGANLAQSFALENLAEIDLVNNNFQDALQKVNQAILTINPALPHDNRQDPIIKNYEISNSFHLLRQLLLKEKIIFEKHLAEKDFESLQACLNLHFKVDSLIENVLSNAFLDQSKIQLLDNMENHSSRALNVSLKLYEWSKNVRYLNNAYYFSSRSKAIVLQKLVDNNNFLANTTNNQLLQEYSALKDQLNSIQKELQQSANSKDSLLNAYTSIQLKFDKFYEESVLQKNQLANKPHVLSIQDVQAELSSGEVLIDFFQGDSLTTFFVLSPSKVKYYQLVNQDILPKVRKIKRSCLIPSVPYNEKLAQHIYTQLFPWMSIKEFAQCLTLYVVPDGAFHGLPFEALVDNDQNFLIEWLNISYGYVSSMILTAPNQANYKNQFSGWATTYSENLSSRLLETGFKDDQSDIGNLEHALNELKACNDLFDGTIYLDKNASVENFLKHAIDSKIIYMSMHGIVDKENGANSCLLFDDRNENFIFRAYELYQQPIQSDLVVLSACHTADGKFHAGEGINGISRAFLASGVNSLVSSLWAASEGSSIKILPAFLDKHASGMTKSEALKLAKKDYITHAIPSQRHPFYWANYILISRKEDRNSILTFLYNPVYLFVLLGGLGMIFYLFRLRCK